MLTKRQKCSCGALVTRAGLHNHLRGISHREGARLIALIGQACLTYREIGKRLGVSYERVRQLAKKLNLEVEDRQAICQVRKITARQKTLSALAKQCALHGLELQLIKRKQSGYLVSEVLINSNRCALRKMCWHKINKTLYLTFYGKQHVNSAATFVIYRESESNIWLIMPTGKLPAGQTAFSFDEIGNWGAGGVRHDYREFLNAWDLLREKSKAAEAA